MIVERRRSDAVHLTRSSSLISFHETSSEWAMKRPMNKHPEAKRIAAKSPQIPGIGSPKHSYFVITLNLMNILLFFKEKMNDAFQ